MTDYARLHVSLCGVVQGVGFRPFVYQLATELSLTGWVMNTSQGLRIEVEGPPDRLDAFRLRLSSDKPALSHIYSQESSLLDPVGFTAFEIRDSDAQGSHDAGILPDIATCVDCLTDIFTPDDRRHLYPFTNCTHCGPRYSIITRIPYDRPNTTMAGFPMCVACRAEYEDPANRRFHAQPIACPDCGPHLQLTQPNGHVAAERRDALLQAADAIRDGHIVAVKGLGGYQLMVDPRSEDAVARLRVRKQRDEKPFAVMVPDLQAAEDVCHISPAEHRVLSSIEAPIVLLERRATCTLAPNLAPGNPCLGIMLPTTPLHHLLLRELGFPVVATSGNLSDEPICIDNDEALNRLGSIADVFLSHNRPIARAVDDALVRIAAGREMVLRRARGYAPLPILLDRPIAPTLALGAHLKNTVAFARGNDVILSSHIGDLETLPATEAFDRAIQDMRDLFHVDPDIIACDLHPDYVSSRRARQLTAHPVPVQHHVAHVVSCMAENRLNDEVLGVSWDGTGYGIDGTIWGGEFFITSPHRAKRIAHLRTFPLPGGDRAVKEPRRTALALLYELFGDDAAGMDDLIPVQNFSREERRALTAMMEKDLLSPQTSSMGRLFDGVSALLGLCLHTAYEGQAAMQLEFCARGVATDTVYPFESYPEGSCRVLDWGPMLKAILRDLRLGVDKPLISAAFHHTLVEMILEVADIANQEKVVLTGGCFQNRVLLENAVHQLRDSGYQPCWHQRVPPNDGGIALGQAVAAAHGLTVDEDRR